ncbi:MAG: ComEC family competence protein [Bacteroidetes bacterium]|nr:ComEC family competence protein [Bacteroidota bacterium]
MSLQEDFHQIPIVRLITPFIIGIIFQIQFSLNLQYCFYIITSLFLLYLVLIKIKKLNSNYKTRWILGIVISLILFFAGIEIVILQNNKFLTSKKDDKGLVIATITKQPVEKLKSIKLIVEVNSIKKENRWINTNGQAIVYIQKDSLSKKINIGNQLMFNSILSTIKNPGNPNEFDYSKYMAFHLISRQAYIQSNNWEILSKNEGSAIFLYAANLRKYLLSIYSQNNIKDKNFAVLSALTLGYKDKLDEQTKRAYSSSGAMHILAVSGLHVGIIYVILNYLLSFLNKKSILILLKFFLIIIFLWCYAFLTGLSPSVMRSSLMFSFVAIGRAIKRNTNIYNTIAASAFLLLIFNPFYIYDVGFQLSYLAVTGIVFFYQRIYSVFEFKNFFVDKIWSLTSVSIAAQLSTFPIAIFYFHKFPNYFLLTNIIVIPFATVLIYLAILLFIFSFFNPIALIIAKILSTSVKWLNSAVSFIESLPYSTTKNIYFDNYQVIIIYLIIILVSLFFIFHKAKYLKLALSSVIIFLIINIYQSYNLNKQTKFIVYNIKNVSAYNFIKGKKNIFFTDIDESNYGNDFKYQVENNWLKLGLKNEFVASINNSNNNLLKNNNEYFNSSFFFIKKNFINFTGKRFLILNQNIYKSPKIKKRIYLDYLILSNNVNFSIYDIITQFDVKQIIIDSSNSKWEKNTWTKDCNLYNINCHSVADLGAYQVDM